MIDVISHEYETSYDNTGIALHKEGDADGVF
jgi:hypothetical protein